MRPYPIHGWPVPPFLLPPRDKAVGGCTGQPGNREENEPTQGGSPLPPLRTAPLPAPQTAVNQTQRWGRGVAEKGGAAGKLFWNTSGARVLVRTISPTHVSQNVTQIPKGRAPELLTLPPAGRPSSLLRPSHPPSCCSLLPAPVLCPLFPPFLKAANPVQICRPLLGP